MPHRNNKIRNLDDASSEIDYLHLMINDKQKQIDNLSFSLSLVKAITDGIRKKKVLVAEGTNEIKFDKPLNSTDWIAPKLYLKINSTTWGDVTINTKRKEGFTCYCSGAGYLDYLVLE